MSARSGGCVVASRLPHARGYVRADIVVDEGACGRERLFKIDHRRQRLKLDHDIAKRVLGETAALRNHHCDRLAHVAYLVPGQRHLRALIEDDARDRRWRHQQWSRLPVIAQIGARIDGDDAGAAQRRRRVDTDDAGVREIGAQKCRAEHSGQLDIIDEQRLSGEQPLILVACDRLAEIARCHAVIERANAGQVPLNLAGRLAWNASTPSRKSSDCRSRL